jgi:deoxyribodipyrimidine photo-lyase
VFISQLGWREFSYYLLHHFPHLPDQNFKENMNFPWKTDETTLTAWKKGQTGFPIIDAGMRQLWYTGTMNNRARLIVSSFLTKNLMTDWRVGAAWFMDTLLDADEANNSAGWQWVAGCGADAAPYFRIFNPILQGQKFDPDGTYVKRWVPELADVPARVIHDPEKIRASSHGSGLFGEHYPTPIVDLDETRQAALQAYKELTH